MHVYKIGNEHALKRIHAVIPRVQRSRPLGKGLAVQDIHHLLQRRLQRLGGDIDLDQVVICPLRQRAAYQVVFRIVAQREDRPLEAAAAQLPDQRQPVHHRHLQVGDHGVGFVGSQIGQRFGAVIYRGGDLQPELCPIRHALADDLCGGLIVDK